MGMSNVINSGRLECSLCNKPIDIRSSNIREGSVICCSYFPNLAPPKDQPCPFSMSGCEAVLSVDEVESHKFDCQFSSMKFCSLLWISNCEDETASVDLLDHLARKHSMESVNVKDSGSLQVVQSGDIRGLGKIHWNLIVIICEGVKFILRTTLIHRKTISWSVAVLGSPETAGRFNAIITILSQTGNSLRWKGPVLSIKERHLSSPDFVLPVTELQEFSAQSGDCRYEWRLVILIENKSTQYPSTSKEIPVCTNQASPICVTAASVIRRYVCVGCHKGIYVGYMSWYRCVSNGSSDDFCQTCVNSDIEDRIFVRIPTYGNFRVPLYFNSLSAAFNNGHMTFEIGYDTHFDSNIVADSDSDDDSDSNDSSDYDDSSVFNDSSISDVDRVSDAHRVYDGDRVSDAGTVYDVNRVYDGDRVSDVNSISDARRVSDGYRLSHADRVSDDNSVSDADS
ncbi:unnamed protein product [Allacma fusca]|uniref:SIAH-type domain-containing protein n=1 Tax=Allacma fusca TaxID=39272 RepID=A0A8J2K8L0_9HEXA|nr:unnamed protein product [Allacma fusca]